MNLSLIDKDFDRQGLTFYINYCKKFFQKNRKTTPTDFVQNRLRIPKLYLACLSDHSWVRNDFLKLTRAPLKSYIVSRGLSGSPHYNYR